jgi:hypothetical protein
VRFAQSVYLIAERPHGSRAAFRLAHSHQRVIDPDNVGDHGLSLAGRVRQSGKPLLVFEYAAEYGSAGDFLVRNADGTWTLVGGWASACD